MEGREKQQPFKVKIPDTVTLILTSPPRVAFPACSITHFWASVPFLTFFPVAPCGMWDLSSLTGTEPVPPILQAES